MGMTMEDAVKGLRNVADWHYGKYEQTHEEDYLNDGDFLTAVANMLKAQAPKVMTLEEVDALGDDDIVWLECLYTFDGKKTATLKPAIYQSENSSPEEDGYYCVVSSWGQSGFYNKDNYMDDWRCWTSRPTDEQREAAKWE